jgi:hypothetical protein
MIGWKSPVNKMVVQFPDENSPNLLKVVASIEDLKMELLSIMMAKDGQNFMIMDGQPSSTNGLCANFPTDNNSINHGIELVQGLGNGAITKFSNDGWSELLGSGTEGNGNIANIQSSFEDVLVLYFINVEDTWGNPWTKLHLQVVAGTTRCLHFLQISVFLVLLGLLGDFN